MKFRLKKFDDAIELELLLKAVKANEDFQQIRFMIKDGKVYVNGEKEFSRRRLLRVDDEVAFGDKFYKLCPHSDTSLKGEEDEPIPDNAGTPQQRENSSYDKTKKAPKDRSQIIYHNKRLLNWSQKYKKED